MITYNCDGCSKKLEDDRIWYNRSNVAITTYQAKYKDSAETINYHYCEPCIEKINNFIKNFNK